MELTSACVNSIYYHNRKGYGVCQNQWEPNKQMLHHRLAYLLAHNLEPKAIEGLMVRHHCDNPACINPEHLALGTAQDNMNDMKARGRHKSVPSKGSKNGMAKLTEDIVKAIHCSQDSAGFFVSVFYKGTI